MVRSHQLANMLRLALVALVAASALGIHAVAVPATADAMVCSLEGSQTVKACTD